MGVWSPVNRPVTQQNHVSGVVVTFEAGGILGGEEHFRGPVIVDLPAPTWLDSEREHYPGSGLRRTWLRQVWRRP